MEAAVQRLAEAMAIVRVQPREIAEFQRLYSFATRRQHLFVFLRLLDVTRLSSTRRIGLGAAAANEGLRAPIMEFHDGDDAPDFCRAACSTVKYSPFKRRRRLMAQLSSDAACKHGRNKLVALTLRVKCHRTCVVPNC